MLGDGVIGKRRSPLAGRPDQCHSERSESRPSTSKRSWRPAG